MRGESERVAARVRELLAEYGQEPSVAEPEPLPPAGSRWQQLPPAGSRWQQLLARAPVRVDPGRSGALAVGVAVVLAAVLTGWWLLSQRPHEIPVRADAALPALSAAPTPVGTDEAVVPPIQSPATQVVVDVAGRVHRPGLYRLPSGARVDDAVRAAGGALHGVNLSSLNLAARVVDGQQILVGATSPPGSAVTPGSELSGSPSAAPVSLNSAGPAELESLPGVGPVLAQKIIDWRTANGGFTSVDQLTEVSGIGDVTFAELAPLVSL